MRSSAETHERVEEAPDQDTLPPTRTALPCEPGQERGQTKATHDFGYTGSDEVHLVHVRRQRVEVMWEGALGERAVATRMRKPKALRPTALLPHLGPRHSSAVGTRLEQPAGWHQSPCPARLVSPTKPFPWPSRKQWLPAVANCLLLIDSP